MPLPINEAAEEPVNSDVWPHKCKTIKQKKSNDTINAFSSLNCSIWKLKANRYSICYNIVAQTIKTNLLGAHTVFHYLIVTRVQFLTVEYELLPLSRPPTYRSGSENSLPLCLGKRGSKVLMFSPNGPINDSTDVSARGVGPLNYHGCLSPLLQVPSIIDPSHICLLIGVAAGHQSVDLFNPRQLRTLKKSSLIRLKKEDRVKLFLGLLFFL